MALPRMSTMTDVLSPVGTRRPKGSGDRGSSKSVAAEWHSLRASFISRCEVLENDLVVEDQVPPEGVVVGHQSPQSQPESSHSGRLPTGHWQKLSPCSHSPPKRGATATDDMPRLDIACRLRRVAISMRGDGGRCVIDRIRSRQTADDVQRPANNVIFQFDSDLAAGRKVHCEDGFPSLGVRTMDRVIVRVTCAFSCGCGSCRSDWSAGSWYQERSQDKSGFQVGRGCDFDRRHYCDLDVRRRPACNVLRLGTGELDISSISHSLPRLQMRA